jgi:hypothetical protein
MKIITKIWTSKRYRIIIKIIITYRNSKNKICCSLTYDLNLLNQYILRKFYKYYL